MDQTDRAMKTERSAKATTDHDFIRNWVEERGGQPACVKGTGGKNDPGMIRIDFPGFSGGDSLEPISWEEWFEQFDSNELALLYRDEVDGREDRFNKLVSRRNADVEESNEPVSSSKRETAQSK
jgi:hypothetical protein